MIKKPKDIYFNGAFQLIRHWEEHLNTSDSYSGGDDNPWATNQKNVSQYICRFSTIYLLLCKIPESIYQCKMLNHLVTVTFFFFLLLLYKNIKVSNLNMISRYLNVFISIINSISLHNFLYWNYKSFTHFKMITHQSLPCLLIIWPLISQFWLKTSMSNLTIILFASMRP